MTVLHLYYHFSWNHKAIHICRLYLWTERASKSVECKIALVIEVCHGFINHLGDACMPLLWQ